jgi:hypothetical protein
MATAPAAPVPVPVLAPASPWDNTEPQFDNSCPIYSKRQRADLQPGTFVLLAPSHADDSNTLVTGPPRSVVGIIARVISFHSISSVSVNIFKNLSELTGNFLYPEGLEDNHLRHLQEVVQTPELRVVASEHIMNLCFVFTLASLRDTSSLPFTCQGMFFAFLLRFRCSGAGGPLSVIPDGRCLPFPSSYEVRLFCSFVYLWMEVIMITNFTSLSLVVLLRTLVTTTAMHRVSFPNF